MTFWAKYFQTFALANKKDYKMTNKYIGIDVGGTSIKSALVNEMGEVLHSNSTPTQAHLGFETSLNNIKSAIKAILEIEKNVRGIGIGLPGMVDNKKGIVITMANIPDWNNVPLAQIIEKEFAIQTKIDNDANCATLGELYFGAGVDCNHFVCITVGTGIGAGIINDGKLLRGFNNLAGEIGHIKTNIPSAKNCGCGNSDCLEAIAATTAMIELAKQTNFANKYEEITPLIIFQEATKGDKQAVEIFQIVGEHIGTGLSSIINILNPQKIIIGGGISKAGDLIFEPIKKAIHQKALPASIKDVEIMPAKLSNTAGVIGASTLVYAD